MKEFVFRDMRLTTPLKVNTFIKHFSKFLTATAEKQYYRASSDSMLKILKAWNGGRYSGSL